MSRPNKNKKIIELSKKQNNGAGFSSPASSSSNSDEGDSARHVMVESLRTETGINTGQDVPTGGSEAPGKCNLAQILSEESADGGFAFDMRIVRILSLDSKESECVLVVDVTPKSAIFTGTAAAASSSFRRRDLGMATTSQKGEGQGVTRKFFRVSEEVMKNLCGKGLKVFEWNSFKKPSHVVELLVDENTCKATINEFFSRNIALKRSAYPPHLLAENSKKKKYVARHSIPTPTPTISATATRKATLVSQTADTGADVGVEKMNESENGSSKQCQLMSDVAEQRTHLLQHYFLKEYGIASARRLNQQQQVHCRMPQLMVPSGLESCKTATNLWLPKKNISVLRNNIGYVKLLLNDDNVMGISNNTGDTNSTDSNDDAANSSNNEDSDSKIKKKNRCVLCRKKVGLTGFECRCGGLYCGIHRYSDKHNCTFDYRQLGAQEIRRNNPVVVGEKIQKI